LAGDNAAESVKQDSTKTPMIAEQIDSKKSPPTSPREGEKIDSSSKVGKKHGKSKVVLPEGIDASI